MKKVVSILAAVSIIMMMVLCLSGCSKIKGTYVCKVASVTVSEMTFDGDSVTKYNPLLKEATTGTYTLKDGDLRIEWEDGKYEDFIYNKDSGTIAHSLLSDLVWTKE